jgi:hypothetical protein
MGFDPELLRHKEWLGLLQPEGLVVSPPALVHAQAFVDRVKAIALQPVLQSLVAEEAIAGQEVALIPDFLDFAEKVLQWEPRDWIAQGDLPDGLEVVLTDYGETLKPHYAVKDPDQEGWLMLIQEVPVGHNLDQDDPTAEGHHGWKATYQQKFERLLKGTQISIGVLWNGTHLRLVYAPAGESSGHLTFPIQAMGEVPGRLILGALEMLLGAERLFNAPSGRTLPKLLEASRNYQAEVSTQLAEQVLDALWELLRGFQSADADRRDALLQSLAQVEPQHIYGGLITTLMRLVFLLYAEDQGLMPDDTVYQRHYSVGGLYDKLREDAGNYPDTMDQRYGAWTCLLSLFRLVYDGGGVTVEYLPARHGQLFDPDEYPFLEGRPLETKFQAFGKLETPRISDGVVYRILEKLLILNGERLSYRALDVEQIGSVYEAIMGYEVEIAQGRSIGIKPKDVVVNVDELLTIKSKDRAKVLQDLAEVKLTGKAATGLKDATTVEEVLAALDRKVSSRTLNLLPPGSLYFQPGEERRRTGSHYTPRKLTQPMVEKTLHPVLAGLGEHPTAEQLLNLKVCDLAMGSGAFLVETCRQLAEKVLEAWTRDNQLKNLPDDVEPLLAARRLVAQRCLYGVDKNPFAVNLAKLSLWLVTLAKDRPFTFVDHALKCGDSLVGLTRQDIKAFRDNAFYAPTFDEHQKRDRIDEPIAKVIEFRKLIQESDALSDGDDSQKRKHQQASETAAAGIRLAADLMVSAYFESSTKKQRDEKLQDFAAKLLLYDLEFSEDNPASDLLAGDLAIAAHLEGKTTRQRLQKLEEYGGKLRAFKGYQIPASEVLEISLRLRTGAKKIIPFNWEVEFPEVFNRGNSGFDAIVGNPPFAGKNTTINGHAEGYLEWLKEVHPESHGNSDLVAHFFRRSFTLLRKGGCLGLIATNTIAQGDTRSTGLRFICNNGGMIYNATRRYKWPGLAAVVVSLVHIMKTTDKKC